jgi:hypothetical protein
VRSQCGRFNKGDRFFISGTGHRSGDRQDACPTSFAGGAFETIAIAIGMPKYERTDVFQRPILRFSRFLVVFYGLEVGITTVFGVALFADATTAAFAMVNGPDRALSGRIILIGLGWTWFDDGDFANR